jgi:hypothetical protein
MSDAPAANVLPCERSGFFVARIAGGEAAARGIYEGLVSPVAGSSERAGVISVGLTSSK